MNIQARVLQGSTLEQKGRGGLRARAQCTRGLGIRQVLTAVIRQSLNRWAVLR